jgi:hypothetical protein
MLESWLAQLVADAPLRKCELIQIDIDLVKRAIDEIESLRGTIKIFRPPGATVARTTRCIRGSVCARGHARSALKKNDVACCRCSDGPCFLLKRTPHESRRPIIKNALPSGAT